MAIDTRTSDAIKAQQAELERQLQRNLAIQQQYGETGAQAIGQSYNELGGRLQTNLGDIRTNVDQGRTGVNSAYDRAGTNISDAESTIRALLGNQIDMGPGGFNAPLQEIQRLSAENAAGRANSLGSYEQLGIGHINAGQMAIGHAAAEGTRSQADLRSQVAAQMADLQSSYNKERANMETELARVLAEEAYREEQRLLEERRIEQERIQFEQEMAFRARELEAEDAQRRAAMELERQLQAEQLAAQARENALDRAAGKYASSGGSGGKPERPIGRQGLDQYFADGVSKQDQALINKAIAIGQSTGDPAAAYDYANANAKTTKKAGSSWGRPSSYNVNPNNRDAVNRGLDIYYGAY